MKKLRALSPSSFLKLLFAFFTVAFLIAAVCMPDRSTMLDGLLRIARQTAKIPTNYFDPTYGGYAGTFLNAACVCLLCTLIYLLPKAQANSTAVIAFLLTAGFSFWGINIYNVWFGFPGVALYCLVKRERLGTQANALLFTTGLAPLISDLLLAYPYAEAGRIELTGILLALGVGIVIGFFLPAGLAYSANLHQGYDLYSAAVPVGMSAFLLRALLYQVLGADRGTTAIGPTTSLEYSSWGIFNGFGLILFALCILAALMMGGRFRDYGQLLRDSGYKVDFARKYGTATMLMNVGIFGLFILMYYNVAALIGANGVFEGGTFFHDSLVFNGVTLGCVFCMLATCCAGSHPGNVWPIMVGYIAASFLFRLLQGCLDLPEESVYRQHIDSQAILIGLCFANGLSPMSGRYGKLAGILAGMLHFTLVTSVPLLHGAFCLYNGGFTAAFVCVLLLPVLERFCQTKEDRRLAHSNTAP